jgi:vesicle-fusing ATPase
LVVLFGKRPPKVSRRLAAIVVFNTDEQGRRLLILATTSNRNILTDMDVLSAFDADIPINPISSIESVVHVLDEVQLFSNSKDKARAVQMLREARLGEGGRPDLMVGVKKLLSMAEMARQDPDPTTKIVASLIREMA